MGNILGVCQKDISSFLFIFLLLLLFLIHFNSNYLFSKLYSFFINKRIPKKRIQRFSKMFLILIVSFSFFYFYSSYVRKNYDNSFNEVDGKEIEFEGVIKEKYDETEYQNRYILIVNNKRVIMGINKRRKIDIGDKVSVIGVFKKADYAKNPGGFNYNYYLRTKKIFGIIKVKSLKIIEKNKSDFFQRIINYVQDFVNSSIDKYIDKEDERELLRSLLIGNKVNLSEEIKSSFRDSNLSHVLAISGMHVSYIILTISFILSKIKIGKNFSKILTIIFLFFFIFLTKETPSVCRACFMGIYTLISSLIHRKPNVFISICISSLIILINNPYSILDLGFQLSFLGTIGIVLSYTSGFKGGRDNVDNKGKSGLKNKLGNGLKNKVFELIKISLFANSLIIPIIAINFNTFSLVFIISNILIAPFIGLTIILGFVFIILSLTRLDLLLNILSIVLKFLLKIIIDIASFCSKIPFSKINVFTPNFIEVFIYYLIVILFIIMLNKYGNYMNGKRKVLKRILKVFKYVGVTFVIYVLIFSIYCFVPKVLRFKFIDVGQGDCTLILTEFNRKILIDGGGSENYEVGKNVLIPYLLRERINCIDYVFISHFDTDHVGGILEILEEMKVKNVIISKQFEESVNYTKFCEIVKKKKINVIEVKARDRIKIDKSLYFDVLWPMEEKQLIENSLNNLSLVLKMVYMNYSILFTGDIEKIAEEKILECYKEELDVLDCDILKVAHHGSDSSSTLEFINAVSPKICLIGVGKDNKYGHPNKSVLDVFTNANCRIYRTDLNGLIDMRFYKEKVQILSALLQLFI